jgi:hypothetical protein
MSSRPKRTVVGQPLRADQRGRASRYIGHDVPMGGDARSETGGYGIASRADAGSAARRRQSPAPFSQLANADALAAAFSLKPIVFIPVPSGNVPHAVSSMLRAN